MIEYTNLVAVLAIAAAVPVVSGLVPRLPVPSVVLEIVAGIVAGPAIADLVHVDAAVNVLALLGLSFLLFLAGLEIDVRTFRGRPGRQAALGLVGSLVLALLVGFGLHGLGVVAHPVIVAVILSATSLGLVVPALKDAQAIGSPVGQLAIAGSSLADVAAVVLLSLFFSMAAAGIGAELVLLGLFVVLLAALALALRGAEHVVRLGRLLNRLQDTTAQIRIRLTVLLVVGLAAVAEHLGLEAILGAFLAGGIVRLVDSDQAMTHPGFRLKLEGLGYGFLVPVFFVTSGLRLDLNVLLASPAALARVPLFVAALLVVRGLPALVYRPELDRRGIAVAGLLQATSLPFIVVGTTIGVQLQQLTSANAAALVCAGLVSVVIFPALSLRLLAGEPGRPAERRPAG